MRPVLCPSEITALYDALSAWRFRVVERYNLPDHKRLSMVARHGIWLIGGEP